MSKPPQTRRTGHAVNIPSFWTGAEALTIVAFLESVIIEIWAAHGDDMSVDYRTAEAFTDNVEVSPDRLRDHDESDTESPF